MKFAVYSLFTSEYETCIGKISGDFKTVEEALTFKSLMEEIELDFLLDCHEIFVSTVLEHVSDEISLKKEQTYPLEKENEIYQRYVRVMQNYNMHDLMN